MLDVGQDRPSPPVDGAPQHRQRRRDAAAIELRPDLRRCRVGAHGEEGMAVVDPGDIEGGERLVERQRSSGLGAAGTGPPPFG